MKDTLENILAMANHLCLKLEFIKDGILTFSSDSSINEDQFVEVKIKLNSEIEMYFQNDVEMTEFCKMNKNIIISAKYFDAFEFEFYEYSIEDDKNENDR